MSVSVYLWCPKILKNYLKLHQFGLEFVLLGFGICHEIGYDGISLILGIYFALSSRLGSPLFDQVVHFLFRWGRRQTRRTTGLGSYPLPHALGFGLTTTPTTR